MRELMNATYDVLVDRLGVPTGRDGVWVTSSLIDQQQIRMYLMMDEESPALTLHVSCARCPIKFIDITSIEQLEIALDYILPRWG
jgi:hypothetical protein